MEPLIENTKKVKKSKNVEDVKIIKIVKAPSKWMLHVKAHRNDNPDKSYKQSLIDAKTTYVK